MALLEQDEIERRIADLDGWTLSGDAISKEFERGDFAGSFGALLWEPNAATAGASGAIFGLMGAAVIIMRDRGINPMESGIGLWIGLNLLITFTVPNISIGGHIGGLIGGGLAALMLFDLGDQVRLPQSAAPLLCGVLGVVAVAGSIAVAGSS